MSNLQTVYSKIYDLLHEIEADDYFIEQRKKPKLNDKALIALSLAAETLGIDSERFLFKQLPESLEGLIERSVYNRRLRRLSPKIECIRQVVAKRSCLAKRMNTAVPIMATAQRKIRTILVLNYTRFVHQKVW